MAIHAGLEDLGSPQLADLLAKDLGEKLMNAQQQLECRICEKVLAMCCHSRGPFYIVRWRETDANTFRWVGQIFEPGMEQEARVLATEKQGEIEIVEFEEAIPGDPPKEILLDAEAKI